MLAVTGLESDTTRKRKTRRRKRLVASNEDLHVDNTERFINYERQREEAQPE